VWEKRDEEGKEGKIWRRILRRIVYVSSLVVAVPGGSLKMGLASVWGE